MGVDFYSCDECGEIYDDCGGMYNNCEDCGRMICFECQVQLGMRSKPVYFDKGAKAIGDYWKNSDWTDRNGGLRKSNKLTSCPHCKNEIIDNEKMLDYLLDKYELTKEQLTKEIKNNL